MNDTDVSFIIILFCMFFTKNNKYKYFQTKAYLLHKYNKNGYSMDDTLLHTIHIFIISNKENISIQFPEGDEWRIFHLNTVPLKH